MPVKILVADDSATMRRIMDMTFGGEDAQVVTVDSGDAAIDKALETRPDVAFIDASMEGMDGYDTARAMKERPELESTAVVVMASQQQPYDDARGRECGVDDHIFKPFDTQYVIDRVQELLSKPRAAAAPRPAGAAEAPAARPEAPAPPPRQAPPPPAGDVARSAGRADTIAFAPGAPPPPPPARQPPAAPAPTGQAHGRSSTAQFGAAASEPARPEPPRAEPPRAAPAPPPPAEPPPEPEAPAVQPSEPPAQAPAPTAAAAQATSSGGDLAQRLHGLGLTRDQVEAVLALSREVIEQVVWEVVPDLAETLIREEIARLTKE